MEQDSREPEFLHGGETLNQRLLGRQLAIVMIIAMAFLPTTLLRAMEIGFKPINGVQALLCFVLMGLYLRRKRLKPEVSAIAVVAVIVVWCLVASFNYGLLAPAHLAVPFVAVLSSIVFGHKVALRFFWTTTAGIVLTGLLYLNGVIHYQVDVQWYTHSWTSWVILVVLQTALALWYLYLIAPINVAPRRAAEHLNAVLQGINDALFVHDKDSGAILQVNQKMCAMYGYSPEEALRLSIGDLSQGSHPYAQQEARSWMDKAVSDGPQVFEWQAKHRDGRVFWVEVNMRLAHLDGTARLLVLVRDVSGRKAIESKLRESEERYRALFERSLNLVYVNDLDGQFIDANDATLKRLGVAREEIRRRNFASFLSPDQHALAFNTFDEIRRTGTQSGLTEYKLRHRDGTDVYVETEGSAIISNGQVVAIQSVARDITDRKRAEAALRDSEERFNRAFQLMPVGAAITTLHEGQFVAINKRHEEIFGYRESELLGRKSSEMRIWASPADRAHVMAMLEQGQPVHSLEAQIVRKDGSLGWISYSGDRVVLNSEEYLLSGAVDITERKRAEEFGALLKASIDATSDGAYWTDGEGHFTYANAAGCKMLGYELGELLGLTIADINPLASPRRWKEIAQMLSTTELVDFESIHRRKDGTTFPVEVSSVIVKIGNNEQIYAFARDITQRKQAEELLRTSEERLRVTLEETQIATFDWDVRSDVLHVSHTYYSMLGYESSEGSADRKEWLDRTHPDDCGMVEATIRNVLHGEESQYQFESRVRHADGTYRWISVIGRAIEKDENDRWTRLIGVRTDITERKRMEAALRASEERYRAVVEQAADGIVVADLQGELLEANSAFAHSHGYTVAEIRALGLKGIDVTDTALVPERLSLALSGESLTLEVEHVRKDGSILPLEVTTKLIEYGDTKAIIAFYRDLTERKRAERERVELEAQLLQSQKMEAIGSLAGGVAHDFNNLLSVISYHTELAMEGMPQDSAVLADLLEVTRACDRAAALTRQLLAFSRKQVVQPVLLNLNDVSVRIEKMLRRIVGEDVEIVQALTPALGLVRADPGQIEQVLLNLAINARDAMPDGGKLTIETSNVEIEEQCADRNVGANPRQYVRLAVADTGCGMDEHTKARIFEPFFTTKEAGRGTGLGLSIVYGIVKQSGGFISVSSEQGRGTSFIIHLPRELSATGALAGRQTNVLKPDRGTETILLVEDEEALRHVAKRILGAAGYTVLVAANGQQALLTSAEHPGPIHLLLTDVVMPKMNGRVLSERMLQARPGIKVIYMSGYTDDAIIHRGALGAGMHFINKPVRAAELARMVREVLDG